MPAQNHPLSETKTSFYCAACGQGDENSCHGATETNICPTSLDTYPTIGRAEVPAGSFIPLRPVAESGFEQLPTKWLVCTPCRDASLGRDVLTVTFAYSREDDARGTAAHLHERGYDVTLVRPT